MSKTEKKIRRNEKFHERHVEFVHKDSADIVVNVILQKAGFQVYIHFPFSFFMFYLFVYYFYEVK